MNVLIVGESTWSARYYHKLMTYMSGNGLVGGLLTTATSVVTAQRYLRATPMHVVIMDGSVTTFLPLAARLVSQLTTYGSTLDKIVLVGYGKKQPAPDGVTLCNVLDYEDEIRESYLYMHQR